MEGEIKRAIAYIRVSTHGQSIEGSSIPAQEARIRQWCDYHRYELVAVYIDAGISGSRMDNRSQLTRALAALKKGMTMIVYSLSRLSRSTRDALTIGDMILKKKVDLVSLSEQIDTTTASGNLMFQMMASMNEFERRATSERTTLVMQNLRNTGRKYTGRTPYGFREDGKNMIEIPEEVAVVREMKAARDRGRSYQAIAISLNDRGIPTKNGKKWRGSTIFTLLSNTILLPENAAKQKVQAYF